MILEKQSEAALWSFLNVFGYYSVPLEGLFEII